MANSPIPRYKAPVEARLVTGENGARIQVNPDGSRYVIKKGKAPAPKGRGTVRTGGPGTSAAQQIVNAALAPLLSSIKSQEGALRSTQAGQQAALRGFTAEIMEYLKGTPAAIQADYQGAIDTTRDLARASAEQFRLANPNAEMQSDLSAIGAPEEQRDALAAQNQNVYGGGAATLFHTGGAIPATAFAQDKAAASAFANSLPAIQGLQGQQLFARLLASQNEDTQKLAAQRAEVLAKGPGLLQDAQAAQAKARQDALNFGLRVQSAELARGRYDLSIQKANQDLAYKSANLSLSERRVAISEAKANNDLLFKQDAANRSAANYYTDAKGHVVPKGYRYNAKGELVRSSTAGKGSSAAQTASGLSRSQSVKTAAKIAAAAVGNAGPIVTDPETGQKGRLHLSYQEAMAQMRSAGVSLVDAQRALNAFWTKPGQVKPWEVGPDGKTLPGGGRPLKAFQERSPQKGRRNVSLNAPAIDFSSLSQRVVGTIGTDLGGPAPHYAKRDSGENWQSNNAWDIGVPVGTPIYAAEDGVIGGNIGVASSRPRDGARVTVDGATNSYYYAHLSRLVARAGQRVKAGQLIGYSGTSQNGAAHLHLGVKHIPGYGSA